VNIVQKNPACLSLLLVSVLGASACTEVHKAWKRPDTSPEVVNQQKDLCKEYAEGSVPWRPGMSGDEKDEVKARVDNHFRRCMNLNGFNEEESVEYK